MANEITVLGSDTAPGSRVFEWPVLEAGNGSFPEGAYTVRLTQGQPGRSFQLAHEVTGASLIERWITDGKILFVCTVASPISAYRAAHYSATPTHEVSWEPDDLGEHPKFTPMIVSSCGFEHRISADSDGVVPQWNRTKVRLRKGSRIAVCPTFELRSGLIGLCDFRLEERFAPGCFKVEPSTEEGFRFKVYLASDLFGYLQYQRQEASRANVMTHVVSAAFSHLKHNFSDDDESEGWRSFSGLRSLADFLRTKGLGHWGDEGFDPEFVATSLYPHRLEENSGAQQ